MSIGKICDLCGNLYLPYGAVIEQEDTYGDAADILTQEQSQLINSETLEENEADDAHYEMPEPNGIRFLTVDPYDYIQHEHQKYDLCPDCMADFKQLLENLADSQGGSD